jgi:HlyD family secretion protein
MANSSLKTNDNKQSKHYAVYLVLSLFIAVGLFISVKYFNKSKGAVLPQIKNVAKQKVTALGRLEPKGEVIQISVSNTEGSTKIAQLLVKQGNRIRTGQVIAILDSYDSRLAALEEAKQKVNLAQANLDRVRAGAKSGEIAAKKAEINRIRAELRWKTSALDTDIARQKAELQNANIEAKRYQALYISGAVSASQRDSKQLAADTILQTYSEAKMSRSLNVATLTQGINEAEATLNRISEVRQVDLRVEEAEVNRSLAFLRKAEKDLNLVFVRSPKNGQVLKVNAYPGEVVGSQGIISLGDTSQMYAVAEVYEIDISQVRIGQMAKVTSDGLAKPLIGIVDQVGLEIAKKDVLDTDPASDVDARVVEVKVRLSEVDSQRVAGLSNLSVKVAITI